MICKRQLQKSDKMGLAVFSRTARTGEPASQAC